MLVPVSESGVESRVTPSKNPSPSISMMVCRDVAKPAPFPPSALSAAFESSGTGETMISGALTLNEAPWFQYTHHTYSPQRDKGWRHFGGHPLLSSPSSLPRISM